MKERSKILWCCVLFFLFICLIKIWCRGNFVKPRKRGSLPLGSDILLHRPLPSCSTNLNFSQLTTSFPSFFNLFCFRPKQCRLESALTTLSMLIFCRRDSIIPSTMNALKMNNLRVRFYFLFTNLNFHDVPYSFIFLHFIYLIISSFNYFLCVCTEFVVFFLVPSFPRIRSKLFVQSRRWGRVCSVYELCFAFASFCSSSFSCCSLLLYLLFWFISSGWLWSFFGG